MIGRTEGPRVSITGLGTYAPERVLTNDPGTGVMRHADAGYAAAIEVARKQGLRMPGTDIPVAAPAELAARRRAVLERKRGRRWRQPR